MIRSPPSLHLTSLRAGLRDSRGRRAVTPRRAQISPLRAVRIGTPQVWQRPLLLSARASLDHASDGLKSFGRYKPSSHLEDLRQQARPPTRVAHADVSFIEGLSEMSNLEETLLDLICEPGSAPQVYTCIIRNGGKAVKLSHSRPLLFRRVGLPEWKHERTVILWACDVHPIFTCAC